jgi:hypothetical protein
MARQYNSIKRRQPPRIKCLGHPWKFYDEGTLITQLHPKRSAASQNSAELEAVLKSIEISQVILSPPLANPQLLTNHPLKPTAASEALRSLFSYVSKIHLRPRASGLSPPTVMAK